MVDHTLCEETLPKKLVTRHMLQYMCSEYTYIMDVKSECSHTHAFCTALAMAQSAQAAVPTPQTSCCFIILFQMG